jgi:hypothetical protein
LADDANTIVETTAAANTRDIFIIYSFPTKIEFELLLALPAGVGSMTQYARGAISVCAATWGQTISLLFYGLFLSIFIAMA